MKPIAFFVLIGLLAGCVTMQSNTKTDAVPVIKRILVVTKMRKAPASYVQNFTRSFPTGYEVCTLAISPLSFEDPDEAIKKQVDACKSDVILMLELSHTGHSSRYSRVPYEYNAEMKSVASGLPFWKAIISANPMYGEQFPLRSVVKRLLEDHILEGKLPSSESLQAFN